MSDDPKPETEQPATSAYARVRHRPKRTTKPKRRLPVMRLLVVLVVAGGAALYFYGGSWVDISGAAALRALYSDTTFQGRTEGTDWTASYCADGTGVGKVGEAEIARRWWVRGEDQVCVESKGKVDCWRFAVNSLRGSQLRAIREGDGTVAMLSVDKTKPKSCK